MDISETYIKMCEKAEEIQALWKPSTGDWFTPKLNLDMGGSDDIFKPQQEVSVNTHWMKGKGYCNGDIADWGEDYWCDGCAQIETKWLTWLPRQDQLQEMVLPNTENADRLGSFLSRFWVFCSCFYQGELTFEVFTSMEQLCLAFVMKENYNKIWNNEDWIKQDSLGVVTTR